MKSSNSCVHLGFHDGCNWDLGFGVFVLVWLVGMMIAVVISWKVDHSILWATVRGILGWIWIAYYYYYYFITWGLRPDFSHSGQ
jgi:hypothetical protein